MKVPLMDLAAQQREVAAEVLAGLEAVFAATDFVGGDAVGRFEAAYASATRVAHCVGAANGTDALELALRAVGVSAGGEVVIPANTFIATAEAVSRIGAVPVLVDVDPDFLLMDPALVEGAITGRTQAVVPVHLFGQVAPMAEIMAVADSAGVPVVEDAAQSHLATQDGRPAGSFGAAAGTSFYPGKNLGAAGDAGAVTTQSPEVAAYVRLLANHGSARKYEHEVVGFNSRMDTIQAVVLSAKLRRLAVWNQQRARAAARYADLLVDHPEVVVPRSAPGNDDAWHLYVVRVQDRDSVLAGLRAAGIGAAIHYPVPVHLTPAYRFLGDVRGAFPVAERAAAEILSLPLDPHISAAAQEAVVAALTASLRSSAGQRSPRPGSMSSVS